MHRGKRQAKLPSAPLNKYFVIKAISRPAGGGGPQDSKIHARPSNRYVYTLRQAPSTALNGYTSTCMVPTTTSDWAIFALAVKKVRPCDGVSLRLGAQVQSETESNPGVNAYFAVVKSCEEGIRKEGL